MRFITKERNIHGYKGLSKIKLKGLLSKKPIPPLRPKKLTLLQGSISSARTNIIQLKTI